MTQNKSSDKRERNRAFFTLEDGIIANVSIRGQATKQTSRVIILTISSGGLSFLGARHRFEDLQIGDVLKISNIRAPLPLGTINEIEMEVKYINDDDRYARIAIGGEFTITHQLYRNKINHFINHRRNQLKIDP